MTETERLYYVDAEARVFDATVLACQPAADGRSAVVLDRTAFYPTSGGQPHDTGRIGAIPVVNVVDDDDGRVVHVLDEPIEPGRVVRGEIDWPRRFDHMQQHTGQHVLSAVLDRLFGVRTLSFHLGTDTSTVDVARDLTPRELDDAERGANEVVWDDRPVGIRFVSDVEARTLPLRRELPRAGTLRLVDIPDCDVSACGGTHVGRTGTIGLIAIVGHERFKGGARVSFVCGGRALVSHRSLRDVVASAARLLSSPADAIAPAIERLQAWAREAARTERRLQEALAVHRGRELRGEAETIGRHRAVIRHEPELEAGGLKGLAVAVVAESPTVAVLAGRGAPAPVVVARGPEADVDAGAIMRELTAALGGRGGGTPELAQGGVAAAPEDVLICVRRILSR